MIAEVFTRIFSADKVRPFAQGGPISNGRRPGHREDAWILDGKLELQHLAAVVGVEVPATTRAPILFGIALHRIFCVVVVNEPVALHYMQSRAVRRAEHVDHGKPTLLYPDGVDYQRIARIVADQMSIPGWRHLSGMRLVHVH